MEQVDKIKLAVFISGRGSNMQALIDSCAKADFPAEIVCVLSNKADAAGLQRASDAGIATEVVSHKDYDSKAGFEQAMLDRLSDYNVNLICLAGFMRILSADFIAQWPEKIINIHPSLLPKHKGLDTHKRAIEAGDTESGCTVHYVVPEMDSGPIIVQKSVSIEDGETEDSLAAKVLVQEHLAYPEAVSMIAKGLAKR